MSEQLRKTMREIHANKARRRHKIQLDRAIAGCCSGCDRLLKPGELMVTVTPGAGLCIDCIMFIWSLIIKEGQR